MKNLVDFISESKESPSYKTWNKFKENHQDRIMLFLFDDVVEIYNEDAIKASKILNIDITKRTDSEFDEIVSFPLKDLNDNLEKLTRSGEKVVIFS